MSRSYKKNLSATCGTSPNGKRNANKAVRRKLKNPDVVLNNKQYKKAYCSWNIRDYVEIAPSFEIFCEREISKWKNTPNRSVFHKLNRPPSQEELFDLYQRWYKRK